MIKQISSTIEITLDLIGGKYKPFILYILIKDGTKRYNELLKLISSISKKTLTNQLRELERDGLIKRIAYDCIPPKVEYTITQKGNSLVSILDAMCIWGNENKEEHYEILNDLTQLCNKRCD